MGGPSDIVRDKSDDGCKNVVANISDRAVTWLHCVGYENAVQQQVAAEELRFRRPHAHLHINSRTATGAAGGSTSHHDTTRRTHNGGEICKRRLSDHLVVVGCCSGEKSVDGSSFFLFLATFHDATSRSGFIPQFPNFGFSSCSIPASCGVMVSLFLPFLPSVSLSDHNCIRRR
jgi:hypothetical protein